MTENSEQPNGLILDLVASKIFTAMLEKKASFNDAYEEATSSKNMKEWDFSKVKEVLITKVKEIIATKKSNKTPKVKADAPAIKETKKRGRKSQKAKAQAPIPTPQIVESAPNTDDTIKKKYATPLAVKVKGKVEMIETTDGTLIKRSPDTTQIEVLCKEGYHGKMIDKDTVGCEDDALND